MLKISDYMAIVLSFVAMLVLYLIVAQHLSISLAFNEPLSPLAVSEGYDPKTEWVSDEPEFAVLAGSQGNADDAQMAATLVSSIKKPYKIFPTTDDITSAQAQSIHTIIVTADNWDQIGSADKLFQYAQDGKTVIFSHLMDGQDASTLNRTLGVLDMGKTIEIEGILLSDKLMVQDDVYHDNLTCMVSQVALDSKCAKLMVEWTKEDREQKDLIPLIWERHHGAGALYVINGDFLNEKYGMGILTGLLSCANDVFVYPVVNAKVSLLDSFPQLDNPYEDRMQELYSRDSNMFVRDIVWPYMVRLYEVYGLVPTARVEESPSPAVQEKFQSLVDMMERRGSEVFVGNEESAFPLPYTVEGFMHSAEGVFGVQCEASGMALVTHYLDMSEVMGKNADDSRYEWNAYSKELSEFMTDIYQDTEWIDAVTLSTAEERYKRYVVMQPEIEQADDSIIIKTGNFDKICFYLIRTENVVSAMSNCEVTRVGDGAYLIRVTDQEATVRFDMPARNGIGA